MQVWGYHRRSRRGRASRAALLAHEPGEILSPLAQHRLVDVQPPGLVCSAAASSPGCATPCTHRWYPRSNSLLVASCRRS